MSLDCHKILNTCSVKLKKVKISELREYISKYKDKKAYEKQLERNAVQTLEGRFREVNCVYNLEMLICLESKMRKLDSESSSTDLYSLNDTLKRYAKKMKKLNRMMGMSIDSKMNDFPKVYDVALQTWADLAIDLDNGNILETIQQSIMSLITKQQAEIYYGLTRNSFLCSCASTCEINKTTNIINNVQNQN